MTAVASSYAKGFFQEDTESGASSTFVQLSRLLHEASKHLHEPVTAQKSDEIFRKLDQVYEECLEEDWDGYGASAISANAYNNACRFLEALPSTIPSPDIIPEPDGEIAFDWHKNRDWSVVVSVGSTDILSYAGLLGKDNKTYGTQVFAISIPKMVIGAIREVCGAEEDCTIPC